MIEINGYQLSRSWFDFCFENPEKISPNHTAIYFFAIEHCNRLGWKEKFGFPTQMTMDAIGIKKHQTYIKYFNDLCEWGFFRLVQKSTNQYSANIISLQNAMPKKGKALDKAFINHAAKQTETNWQSTWQSNSSIDKPLTSNKEPLTKNKEQESGAAKAAHTQKSLDEREKEFMELVAKNLDSYPKEMLRAFYDYWTEKNEGGRRMRFEMQKVFDIKKRLVTWKNNEKKNGSTKKRESTADLLAGIQQRIVQDANNGAFGGGF